MSSLSIPKVTIGRAGYGKSKINLNHDVSTSSDWGFVQPIMCKKMVANSTLHLNALRSVVRVSPLVKPTFGSASWKTYHRFVPIADIYEPYEYFLKGEPYFVAGQSANYVPSQMPWIYVSDLSRILLGMDNKFTIFYSTEAGYKSIGTLAAATRSGIISAFISQTVLSNGQESGINANNYLLANGSTITIESADSILKSTVTYSGTSYTILVCFRFNRKTRNARKILLGCGYQFDPNLKREVCILPLMAYYRAYFELFAPKRDTGWSATDAFYILDNCRESGLTNIVLNSTVRVRFKSFLGQIAYCYYTDDTDFISAHILTPSVGSTAQGPMYVNSGNSLANINPISNFNSSGVLPVLSNAANMITSYSLRLLDRLTKAANKDSQIVHRLDDWLSAHGFGKSLVDIDPYAIGSDSVPIQIQSVMSTAETEDAGLGDFAGSAVGFKDNDNYPDFDFTAQSPGYWITLGCCVPDTGWFQGLAPDSGVLDVKRYDEYFPEYDAIGFEISTKDQVVCDGSVTQLVPAGSDPVSMGFIPRYSRHKVIQNIVNGDLSLRSQRNDALPYTLDRYITPFDVRATGSSGTGENVIYTVLDNMMTSVPTASTEYRYIGKSQFMGNYDRIFQNYYSPENPFYAAISDNDPSPDHFIIHNYFDMVYMAPMLSMKDSFDTDSFDSNTMDVEKG